MFESIWGLFGKNDKKELVKQTIEIDKVAFNPQDPLHVAQVKEVISKFNQAASNLKSEDMKYGGVAFIYFLSHYALLNTYLALVGYAALVYAYKEDKLFDRKRCHDVFSAEMALLERTYAWVCSGSQDVPKPDIAKDIEAVLKPYMQPAFENGKWRYLLDKTWGHLKATTDTVFEHAHAIKDDAIMVVYGKESDNVQLTQMRPM